MPLRPVAIVIPCYNEEKRLNLFVFRRFLADSARCRLIFVNDGSRDGTLDLLRRFEAVNEPGLVEVVDISVNGGKAEAVRLGMQRAMQSGADLVGFWDADLATPLDAVDDFLHVFDRQQGIEIVVGSRIPLLGHAVERNPKRGLLGRCFAWAASWALGVRLADTQCGAKMFRSSPVLQAVLARNFLSRWIFDVEMLARWRQLAPQGAPSLEACLYERPLEVWREIKGSRLKVTDFMKAPWELLTIYLDSRGKATVSATRAMTQLTAHPADTLKKSA